MNELTITPQQKGWLTLADMKAQLFAGLEKGELSIQGTLATVKSEAALPDIQTAIKTAKAQMKSDQDARKNFTGLIEEKLTKPAMAFEKRNAEAIAAAETIELSVRKRESAKAQEAALLAQESAQFTAHVSNEYYRMAATYRQRLAYIINNGYTQSLQNKELADIAGMEATLNAEEVPKFVKYNRVLLSDAAAMEIFTKIKPYTKTDDLKNAITALHHQWSMFAEDVANAEAAIAQTNKAAQEAAQEVQQEVAIETATNTLMAQAEYNAIPEGPKVKRKMEVEVVNSEAWAKAVIANFIKNWPDCAAMVRVKSWDKLSLSQMAAALGQLATSTGETFTGLGLIETEK